MKPSVNMEWPFILLFGVMGQFMLVVQFIWFAPFLFFPTFMCFLNVFLGVRRIRRNYRRYPRADT